jgi:hypothetical protein
LYQLKAYFFPRQRRGKKWAIVPNSKIIRCIVPFIGHCRRCDTQFDSMLGGPCSGYINFTSVYIAWLCGAIFLHLPSFASLGIDFKTDLSLLLTVFLFSLLVSLSSTLSRVIFPLFLRVSPGSANECTGQMEMTHSIDVRGFTKPAIL